MKQKIQNVLNRFGYHLSKYPDESQRRRIKLLELRKINLVLDVGANGGHYASELRRMGYKGRILSFEPLTSAFEKLREASARDADWNILNVALGDKDEISSINISNNSFSSSILSMGEAQTLVDSKVHFVGKEAIVIKKLDSIFDDHVDRNIDQVFLKVDAQGYEGKIISGAESCIKDIQGIQIEMPLKEIYKGQELFGTLFDKLQGSGFNLQGLELGYHNPKTLELYEMDGIFFR